MYLICIFMGDGVNVQIKKTLPKERFLYWA
ncbi:hypothetical protein EDF73_10176 [Raoultella sp. BIGb0138]|nr:hypothetical protein EDF73_10176 [Raoultella sp. BIGb0138]